MLKSIVVHDIPLDAYPAMERWYYRDHSPEISRRRILVDSTRELSALDA